MRLLVVGSALLAALASTLPALGGSATTSGPCSSGNVVSTASYQLALTIGPMEEMYTPAEVKARHLKTGEIMLGGDMSMVGKPPAGSRVYHLELHICVRKSGAVVTKLKPVITVDDPGAKVMAMAVPSAIMVGVGAPMTDYHYGNDVVLRTGDRVTVTVTVKGQRAVFHALAPAKF